MASSSRGAPTTGNEFFFGWDFLYKTVEKDVNKKSDILIILAHFLLVKCSNFRCIGVGEDKTISEDEVGSELLPDGWNDNENYSLRYMYNGKLYLLIGHVVEDCIIMNLLDVQSREVSNIALQPDKVVKELKGSIHQMVPNVSHLVDRYRTELVDPVFQGTTRQATTQTSFSSNDARPDPLRIGDPMRPRPMGQFMPAGVEPRPFGFPDVGRGDLDPLGRLGPGNLLPFPSHPDIRGGGVRPRFDPYGPDPNALPNANPNPDHFRPPDYGHDYYM